MSEGIDSSSLGVPSPAIKEPSAVGNKPPTNIENHPKSPVQTSEEPQAEAELDKPAIEPPVALFTSKGFVHPNKVPERVRVHRKRSANGDPSQTNTSSKKAVTAAKALADKPSHPARQIREPVIMTIKRPVSVPSQVGSAPKETPEKAQPTEETKTIPPKSDSSLGNEKQSTEVPTSSEPQGNQEPLDKKVAKPTKRVIMRLSFKKSTTPKPEEAQEPAKVVELPKEGVVEMSKSAPDHVDVKPPPEEVPQKSEEAPNEKIDNPDPLPQENEKTIKSTKEEEAKIVDLTKPLDDESVQENPVPQEPEKPIEGTIPEKRADLLQDEPLKDIEEMEESNSALIQEGISHLIESMNEKLFQPTPLEDTKTVPPNIGLIQVGPNGLSGPMPGKFVQIIPIPHNPSMIVDKEIRGQLFQPGNLFQGEARFIGENKIPNGSLIQVIPGHPGVPIDKLMQVDQPIQDKRGPKPHPKVLMKIALRNPPMSNPELPLPEIAGGPKPILNPIEKTSVKLQKVPEKAPKKEFEKGPGKVPTRPPEKAPVKNPEKKQEKSLAKKPEKTPEKTRSKSLDKLPEKKPEKTPAKTHEKSPVKVNTKTPAKKSAKEEEKSNKTPQKQPTPTPKSAKKKAQEMAQDSDSETETETDTDCDCMLDSSGRMGSLPPSKRIKIDLFRIENEISKRRYLTAALTSLNTRSEIIATLIENANAEWSEVRKSKTKRNRKN